jgi:hypothetical protein
MVTAADEDGPRGDEPETGMDEPSRSLWRGLISLAILVAMAVGLLLAVPGLHGVADAVSDMSGGWLAVAVGLEILSCVGYVVAFLQVFDRATVRFGARVALSELAFGAAVSLGGLGVSPSGHGCWWSGVLRRRGSRSARRSCSCSPAQST